jgi:hypothetical protein
MFTTSRKRRARPSWLSLGLSLLVFTATIWLAVTTVFYYYVYMPVIVALAISTAVFLYRARSLRARMPAPYGGGEPTIVTLKAAMRSGILLTVGGGGSLVGLMATVFFLPPVISLSIIFGLIIGLPLSEILFFTLVTRYERRSGTSVFFVNEETEIDGETALVKTVEMSEV